MSRIRLRHLQEAARPQARVLIAAAIILAVWLLTLKILHAPPLGFFAGQ